MNPQSEALMSLIAALLVLFSSLFDPWISAVLAFLLLIAFSTYKFWEARRS